MRVLATAAAAVLLAAGAARADDTVKIGLITPLTGPFASTGQEMQAAAKLFLAQHGGKVAGKTVELIIRDDGAVPDTTKRLAQQMIVNDHVGVLAGMGLTPLALAVAPLATQAKVPLVVMGAATSAIPNASPYIVRSSFAVPQDAAVFGDWAAKNGVKSVVTLVSDYAPGIDEETWFKKAYEAAGGKVVASLRAPLANPDFAPFLQRAADAHPDGLFLFTPSGQGAAVMKQFVERGLDKSGIKLLVAGDVLDEELIDRIGPVALGLVSAYHYSDAHDSALNKSFTAAFAEANKSMRPNMMAVGAYDGMALIFQALEKTGGSTDGTKLVDAMKGAAWESPRGPVSIDPQTREIVQNVYLRKVEQAGDRLANVEFATVPNVKDPAK